MSNYLFPSLIGLTWDRRKTPQWKTMIQQSVSGKETRVALMSYPIWLFSLSYEVLNDATTADLKTLIGFFNKVQGSYDSFLYEDPSDKTITDQVIGEGDGSNRYFQLIRTYGGFAEPIKNINGIPVIKVNGVTKQPGPDYNISSTGLVTFTIAPANHLPVTATFNFFYRCRFAQDSAEFNQFMSNLWELQQLEFVSVKI